MYQNSFIVFTLVASSSTDSSSTLSEEEQLPMQPNRYSREFVPNGGMQRAQSPPIMTRGYSPPQVMMSAAPAAPPPPPPMMVPPPPPMKSSPMDQLNAHKGK